MAPLDDVDLGDTVDSRPLRLVLAMNGLLDGANRLWPTADDIPAELREPLRELNEIWIDAVAAATEGRREHA